LGIINLPFLSIKLYLPSFLTSARPSEKKSAESWINGMIKLPNLSINPYLPSFLTAARPSEKESANS
jgi:hypothetical protein